MTASRMASAMRTASWASAMAVFMRTPSAPSSMATAASDAVPTPASTIMGTAEIRGVLHAEAGADGRGERHNGGGAGVDQLAGSDQIVIRVGQDDKTLFDEDASGFDELLGVREKSLLVTDDFELDPIREADFAREARGADGLVGGVTGGGIRQDEDFFAVDVIQQ